MSELRRYDYAIQNLLPSLWLGGFQFAERDRNPVPGDLVMLQSAPMTEWHLSWYVEKHPHRDEHLLESLKTGKQCNWSNVGLIIMSRKWVRDYAKVRWTDEQFGFERLFTAERQKAEFYLHLPYIDRFEGDQVHIGFRVRHGFSSTRTVAEPFTFAASTRADLRCHLWKWCQIHMQNDRAERLAAKEGS